MQQFYFELNWLSKLDTWYLEVPDLNFLFQITKMSVQFFQHKNHLNVKNKRQRKKN